MLVHCQGFVIRVFKHTDRSMIMRCFTDQFGLRSYVVRYSKKTPRSLFQPLTLLSMSVQERNDRDLQQLKEVSLVKSSPGQSGNMLKSTLSLFIQEFLVHALREESGDSSLFTLLAQTVTVLDLNPGPWTAHQFLIAFGNHMGILPPPPDNAATWFDLEEGSYSALQPAHIHCFGAPWSQILPALQLAQFGEDPALTCTADERRDMLDKLLLIFRYHTQRKFELRSPKMLREVLA